MNNVLNFTALKEAKELRVDLKDILNGDMYRFVQKRAEDFESEMKESLSVFLHSLKGDTYEVFRKKEEMMLRILELIRDNSSEEELHRLVKVITYVFPAYLNEVNGEFIKSGLTDDGSFVVESLEFESYKKSVESAITRLNSVLEESEREGNVKYFVLVNDLAQYMNAIMDHDMFGDHWE